MQKGDRQSETLPSEVIALCRLMARIMNRCLLEQDTRFLDLLKQSTSTSHYIEKSNGKNEHVA